MYETKHFIIMIEEYSSDNPVYIYIDFASESGAIEQFNKLILTSSGSGFISATLHEVGITALDLSTVISLKGKQITDKWIEELILEVG